MNYGFRFMPTDQACTPGSRCLEVHLRREPTLRHFDPDQLQLTVISPDLLLETLTVYHPWNFAAQYIVTVGMVRLIDRKGQTEDAFTFGGRLTIENVPDKTVCLLESSAPILHPKGFTDLPAVLADEAEIMLAEMRAADLPSLEDYEFYLIHTRPLELYGRFLWETYRKFREIAAVQSPYLQSLADFLDQAVRDFRTQHPEIPMMSPEE